MTDYTPPERVYLWSGEDKPTDATDYFVCDERTDDTSTEYIRADLVEAAKQAEFLRIKVEAEAYAKCFPLDRYDLTVFMSRFFAALERGETFLSPKNDE